MVIPLCKKISTELEKVAPDMRWRALEIDQDRQQIEKSLIFENERI